MRCSTDQIQSDAQVLAVDDDTSNIDLRTELLEEELDVITALER